ncbi:MAG: hypothetical protein AB1797_05780 [bacterium]
MLTKTDILFFVEDPGAANYMAELPKLLRQQDITSIVLADGKAVTFLRERGVEVESVQTGVRAEEIVDRYQPKLLSIGTSQNADSLGLSLIDCSRAKGIPTVGMIDMEVDAELRFRGKSKSALTHAPDWLLVPDESTKRTFEKLGYPGQQIKICGNPNYDRVRQAAEMFNRQDREKLKRRLLPEASLEGRPIVVFVSEHVDGREYEVMHRSPQYTLYGRGDNDSRTAIVLEEILDALSDLDPKPYLVIRLHPKNRREEFNNYLEEVDFFSVGGDPLELIWIADLVVGMTSMLMMEAVVLGKQTLAVLPRISEKSWSPDTANELTPCVTTRQELRGVLNILLHKAPDKISKTSTKIIYGASERVSHFLVEKIKNMGESHKELR